MAKRESKSVVQVRTSLTNTVKAVNTTLDDMFVPGWDRKAAAGQQMTRTRERAEMGAKMTPLGAGKLMKR